MKGLRFLPPFASWLPCHMDGGRRHKILGSEIKNFITHGTARSMQFMFVLISSCNPNSSETRQRGPCEGHACRGFAFQLRSSGLREPKSFIKHICTKRRHHFTRYKTNLPPALEGDAISPKAICYKNILEKMGQNKSGQCLCSQAEQKHRELSLDKTKNSYTPIVLTVH